MKILKLFLVLFCIIFIDTATFSKEIQCLVIQRRGDGSGMWGIVKETSDLSHPDCDTYTLNCLFTGTNKCEWSGGVSPCGSIVSTFENGKFSFIPFISKIEVTDDNGNYLPFDINIANKMIMEDINLKGNTKNIFVIDGKVAVSYNLYIKDDTVILESKILTGKELEMLLKGGF